MSKQVRDKSLKNWANLSRSILNGVVGDYLEQEQNPLAIEMAFYHQNQALTLDHTLAHQITQGSDEASVAQQRVSNKVIVLIHGLTNLETIWDLKPEHSNSESMNDPEHVAHSCKEELSDKDNYGRRLQEEFDFTPFYLRYNTGLSIKENGEKLNDLLSELMSVYPIPIDEVVLMGFSMGGLLIRSAQKLAKDNNANWLSKLSNCYYIGTPHEGSPLEKFGHLTSSIVRYIPRDYISQWADWIDLRSQGIQDLKDGLLHLKDEGNDSEDEDPYEQSKRCGSFSAHAQHHFISGALSANKDSLLNRYFGDSLVRHSSANPISAPENSKKAHFNGISHVPLAHSDVVYQQIRQWFIEHQTFVETRFYAMPEGSDKLPSRTKSPKGLSNQEIISGTLDLLTLAYDQTVDAVEKAQIAIADEPYSILKKIPGVREVTKPIEGTHKEILDVIYFSLREGGKLVNKGAQLLNTGRRTDANDNSDLSVSNTSEKDSGAS